MLLIHFSRLFMLGSLLGGLHLTAYSQELPQDDLSSYEQQLFSHSFQTETLESRLNRLETSVFGEQQTGSIPARHSRLMQILIKAQKASPKPSTSPNVELEEADSTNPDSYSSISSKQPDATDYPTVTALEREVFGRDFVFDSIDIRLNRLEKKVFKNTYERIALVDRVDKLLMRYPNISGITPEDYPNSAIRDLPAHSSQLAGSRDTYTKVEALEQTFFEGRTFSEKLMPERLEQLEMKAYGHTYPAQSVDMRVARLLKGFEAENNKVASNNGIASRQPTLSQPTYTHPDNNPPASSLGSSYIPNTSRPPQNIQIGAGFSQNSTHSFSPELIEMLPNDIKNQLTGQKSTGTGNRSVIASPGTVIVEQSTTYPGFNTYGNAPIQYRNYYTPNVSQSTTTTKQTTTLIQPDGTAAVYTYQNTPVYTGNPTLIQNLGQLEINVFGQVNTIEPVPIRLGKLETVLLGQAYPSYPEAERLAHLQKVYQYQSLGRLFSKTTPSGSANQFSGSKIIGVPLSPTTNPSPSTNKSQNRTSGMGVPMFNY